ncbi:hypothetical protein INS49_005023 [Diaporthe citri]|uniref:uncharacterized protein n=1 Tax=Diaporthe citri TaxID=83186 RepID=UPI001C7EBCF3|nr:uncharacterized protein INS49_005023 [Diaporthe citri]KAG6354052.1 hypothetical protein INS49_005023 [Diaporthe citri]
MAEGHYTDQNPSSSMSMEALSMQDRTQEDARALSRGLASLPMEMILEMVESLPPAHDTVQTGYAGSDALHSAQAGLDALRALCGVSRQMQFVAKPHLYRTIVVSDPYKLHRLRKTLDTSPELGEHVKSLTVYRYFAESDVEDEDDNYVPENMTLSQFSETLVAVLEKTPNLVTLSLNFDRTTEFQDSRPFETLGESLHMDISRAKDSNHPQGFLPNVVTLGILLPSGEASEIQRSGEYQIFNDLLNLPSLSHIVVRRPGPGPFQGREIYAELLVLIADLRVFPLQDADGENVAPVPEDYQDQRIPVPYPIARHMTIPWTIWFLEAIEALSPTYFPQLNTVGLEYETSQINDHGFAVINQILNSSERYFVSKMQALQGTMEQKGIHFSLTKL